MATEAEHHLPWLALIWLESNTDSEFKKIKGTFESIVSNSSGFGFKQLDLDMDSDSRSLTDMDSVSFLFKTRVNLAESTWFVRWETLKKLPLWRVFASFFYNQTIFQKFEHSFFLPSGHRC